MIPRPPVQMVTEYEYVRVIDYVTVAWLNQKIKQDGWFPVREVQMGDHVLVLIRRTKRKEEV